MTKEFNLSKLRDEWDDGIQKGAVYEEKDVREFIKQLKKEIDKMILQGLLHYKRTGKWSLIFSNTIIDRLAGDKLT